VTGYEQLALRSFDHPLDADEQEAMRVWGDALESAGDPRGALITIEYAIRDRPERRHELGRAINEHLVEHASEWISAIAPLTRVSRALELEFRSGLLYGAFLDTRRTKETRDKPADAVQRILGAPAAKTLRRLHVRVRQLARVREVLELLAQKKGHKLPLEEIVVRFGVRATRLGRPYVHSQFADERSLPSVYPGLRHLEIGDCLASLPFGETHVVNAPSDPVARTYLGRALGQVEPNVRAAAIARLAAHGRAGFMFRDTLLALLGPGMPAPQAGIAACLARCGEHARSAIRPLAIVTGRTKHYDVDTRRAAGVALAALRA
jgi:hypothetical protein